MQSGILKVLGSFLALGLMASSVSLADEVPGDYGGQPSATHMEKELSPEEEVRELLLRSASTRGPGRPALWQMSDHDTRVYLFGSIHVLPVDAKWRNPTFDAAFESADLVVFESDIFSVNAIRSAAAVDRKLSTLRGRKRLPDLLTEEEVNIVGNALEELNIPPEPIERQKPWRVLLTMSDRSTQISGYSRMFGVESVLEREASAARKTFDFLETQGDVYTALDAVPIEEQIKELVDASESVEFSKDILRALTRDWLDGDLQGLELLGTQGEQDAGAFEAALLDNRNEKWLPKIKSYLARPGTVFVAVGAAHLVGDDGIIASLREDGFKVEGP